MFVTPSCFIVKVNSQTFTEKMVTKIVRFLLDSSDEINLDASANNSKGDKGIQLAIENGHSEIVMLLFEKILQGLY